MKKLLLFVIVLAAAVSCQDNQISIKGHVKFTEPGMQMALYRWGDHVKDTVAVVDVDENQNYAITASIAEPGVYFLDCGHWERVSLWAEDEDMTIDFRGVDTARIKIKNPPFVFIKGSPKNQLMNDLNFNNHRNYQTMIAISQAAYDANFASGLDKDNLTKKLYDANYADLKARDNYLLERYSDCPSVLAVIAMLDPVADEELIGSALDKLEQAHPGYKPAAKMREDVAARKESIMRMMVGQPAPLFKCPSPDGTELGPEDFRGKLLLIDFWASWCGPCRGEVPNLKKTYAQFKDKGVEFLSVSIDKSEEAWKKAMAEEGMEWPQVLAPKAGAEVMDNYQFGGIPFIILLDKEGKIVAKNLRGEAIGKTIGDLLDGYMPGEREKEEEAKKAAEAVPAASMGAGMMIPATTIKRK